MSKGFNKNKFWVVVGLCLTLVLSSSNAFARDRGGERNHDRGRNGDISHHREVIVVGHHRYHYRDGHFFRPGWFGFEFLISAPPIGAVIRFLPAGHRVIVVRNTTYYYYDNIYYQPCPSGYIVVPAPVVSPNVIVVSSTVQPQTLSGETMIVNVPNKDGSYTAVTLIKSNNGYVGPQGEFYSGNPTVEQLKVLYGK
ncbi:MAG TPA: hypothetical protein PL155_03880 [Candidatus Omnitrophota bacterium]|nr:hypothetical protein [Candidatus Omnitrophota bacterium]HPD84386.1 hypothetical protein [Candidatus Omnitrophota bacterium]HRZ03244.1 hypothetical protein [Candidatus Omnitrophota bacterium]